MPKPTEQSEVFQIRGEDVEEFTRRAQKALEKLCSMAPEDVQCMMAIVVSKAKGAGNKTTVKVSVLGNDGDIAKMFMTLTTVARNGVVQAHAPSNPTNEVPH